jgi:hypothetical protein
MTNLHGRMPTKGKEYNEHDDAEGRKRVATWIDGNVASYEDTNFTSGESPAVLDVYNDLGRIAHEGYFINDGPGDILVEFSYDSSTYGGQHTVHGGDILDLRNLKIMRIRLTYVDPTEYRVLVG